MGFGPLDTTEEDIALILRVRQARAQTFGPGLFSDVAWDILLQLFVASLGDRKVGLSDLETLAPKSTVARWTAVLQERGLVSCRLDRLRSDELWIELSSAGIAKMAGLFDNLHLEYSAC